MEYKYKCGNEIIHVWVWNDDRPELSVYDNKTNKSFERSILEDEKGKFFTWNKNKIYLNDWIRISVKELKEKIDRNEFVISDDLCQAILSDGIDNVRFIVPLNVVSLRMFGITMYDNSEFKDTLCKIEEGWNREVRQNYKLTLVPVEPDDTVERNREFYTSDMIQLIQEGIIKIIV